MKPPYAATAVRGGAEPLSSPSDRRRARAANRPDWEDGRWFSMKGLEEKGSGWGRFRGVDDLFHGRRLLTSVSFLQPWGGDSFLEDPVWFAGLVIFSWVAGWYCAWRRANFMGWCLDKRRCCVL